MFERILLCFSMVLIYYNVGGLATTNILRLTSGNSNSINSSKCFCDVCLTPIPPLLQLPIVSYVICKGKCKVCGSKIPVFPLVLEIIVICGMTAMTGLYKFSSLGVVFSFVFYEIIRIITIIIKGKRSNCFVKQYLIATVSMFPFFVVSIFVSYLYHSI